MVGNLKVKTTGKLGVGCSEGYNQNYWPETGQCFEWYSRGPCPESFLFVYNRKEGKTECICDEQDGYVFWNETGRCYRVYSQVPNFFLDDMPISR